MRELLDQEIVYEEKTANFFDEDQRVDERIAENKIKYKSKDDIKVKFKRYFFGLPKSALLVSLIALIYFFTQLFFFLIMNPYAQRAENLITLFILGAETSTSFSSLHLLMLQTVLYNNTIEGWHGKTTLESFQEVHKHIKDNILEGYMESIDLDFGSYTNEFGEIMSMVKTPEQNYILLKLFSQNFL